VAVVSKMEITEFSSNGIGLGEVAEPEAQ